MEPNSLSRSELDAWRKLALKTPKFSPLASKLKEAPRTEPIVNRNNLTPGTGEYRQCNSCRRWR